MSSSTEVSPAVPPRVSAVALRDLRVGQWTRLGPDSGLGDEVSERTLAGVAEQARAAAQAQGYAVGWAQGRREAAQAALAAAEVEAARHAREEERREAEHREAVAALHEAAAQVRATITSTTARVEEQGTDLAWALTEELVGHEVRGAEAADVVRRVLAAEPTGRTVRVRLHPDHVAAAGALLEHEEMTCVADPSLGRLDAVVEVDGGALDLRLGTAMARVRQVLS